MEPCQTHPKRPPLPRFSKLDEETNFNLQMSADTYFKYHKSVAYGRFCEALSLTQEARLKYKIDKYEAEDYWEKWVAYVTHPNSPYSPRMRENARNRWIL